MITPSLPAVCGLKYGVSGGSLYPSTSGSFLVSAEGRYASMRWFRRSSRGWRFTRGMRRGSGGLAKRAAWKRIASLRGLVAGCRWRRCMRAFWRNRGAKLAASRTAAGSGSARPMRLGGQSHSARGEDLLLGLAAARFSLPTVELFLQLLRVKRSQLRVRLCEPDQIQFILLPLAQASTWISVGPELAPGDIFQASDPYPDTQDLGLNGPGQERLIPFVRGELNPEFASRGRGVQRVRMFFGSKALLPKMQGEFRKAGSDHHEIGIKGIYRLDVAIDRQTADQAVGSERFAGCDQPYKVRGASPGCQLVSLHSCHTFTLYDTARFRQARSRQP